MQTRIIILCQVWYAAVTQSFFSLSVGFGTLTTYSSYNKFRHNTNKVQCQLLSFWHQWTPTYFPSNFQQEEGAARCYIWILFDVDWCKNLTTLPPGRADHQLRGHLHLAAGRHRHLLHPRPPRARARAARGAGRQVRRRPRIRQLPRGADQWEHATRSRDHNAHLWLVRCWPSSTSCRSCSPSSSSWCWSRSASAPRSASSPPSPPPSTTPSRASTRSSSWKYAAS